MTTTAAREKPILMSGPMVLALLAGRKTQTRRVLKMQPIDVLNSRRSTRLVAGQRRWTFVSELEPIPHGGQCVCSWGEIGDRLWVREAFQFGARILYRASDEGDGTVKMRWSPGIHMRREYSRLTLEITDVRVERLQSISAKDILAEGVDERAHYDQNGLGKCPVSAFDGCCYVDLLSLWAAGWDKINGKRAGCAWKDNPWLWCLSFKVVT